eukprot:SAG31_NODE_923_length_10969_cov_6.723091_6_plen_740_part_00
MDEDLLVDELIGTCVIKLDALPPIHNCPGAHGFKKEIQLYNIDEMAGKIEVLVAYESNPITHPQLIKFSSSAMLLEDRLTPPTSIGQTEATSILQFGGPAGLRLTYKRCLADCLGHPVDVTHIKTLKLDIGTLHVGCTTLFLDSLCKQIASIVPLLMTASMDVRVDNALQALISLAQADRIPQAIVNPGRSNVYCEESKVVQIGKIRIELAIDIKKFVEELADNAALVYICESMGTSLAVVTADGKSSFGVKIGLTLLSQLVTIHLSLNTDGFAIPHVDEGILSSSEIAQEARANIIQMGPVLIISVLAAICPNPFRFITSGIKNVFTAAASESAEFVAKTLSLSHAVAPPRAIASGPRKFGADGELIPRQLKPWRSWPALSFHINSSLVQVEGGRDGQAARLLMLQADLQQKKAEQLQERILAAVDQQEELRDQFLKEQAEAEAAEAELAQANAAAARAAADLAAADAREKHANMEAQEERAKSDATDKILHEAKKASRKNLLKKYAEGIMTEEANHVDFQRQFQAAVKQTWEHKRAADAAAAEAAAQKSQYKAEQLKARLEQEEMEAELARINEQKAQLAAKLAAEQAAIAEYNEQLASAEAEAKALDARAKEDERIAILQTEQEKLEKEAVWEHAADEKIAVARALATSAVTAEKEYMKEQEEADIAIAAANAARAAALSGGEGSEAEQRYRMLAAKAEKEIAEARAAKVAAEAEQKAAQVSFAIAVIVDRLSFWP